MRAWLALAVGDNRQHGGNDGYDDDPATHYSWDSTVPNHAALSPGDLIALWDKRTLLGASVIESIETGRDTKARYSCPLCGKASLKARKTLRPRYKCFKCGGTFDEPAVSIEAVTTYRTAHREAWSDLAGILSAPELRRLCASPNSQLSIRPLDGVGLEEEIRRATGLDELRLVRARQAQLIGGHDERLVRVRLGQAQFRRSLLAEFDAVCAFSGELPEAALEAAHLHSYGDVGQHHEHGGLLLRRDLHALFDRGQIAVNPRTTTLDVVQGLGAFPLYASLAGASLRVEISAGHRDWLKYHWHLHRPRAGG